jgi:hypothetical protein
MDHKAGKYVFDVSSIPVTSGFQGRIDYRWEDGAETKQSYKIFDKVCLTNVDAEMHAKAQFELRVRDDTV